MAERNPCLDRAAENMLDKTFLYTGATRAQQKLIICCEDETLIDDAVAVVLLHHSVIQTYFTT